MIYSRTMRRELIKHFKWHPSRLEIFSLIILSILKVRSISLPRIAEAIESEAKTNSIIKRITRFLSNQIIDDNDLMKLIIRILSNKFDRFQLVIDRTNWEFGCLKINILYVSIIYQNMALPLVFRILNNQGGNSCSQDRIELMNKILQIIPPEQIAYITGDREFFSEKWIEYLSEQKIAYVFRVKCSQKIRYTNLGKISLKQIIEGCTQDVWVHLHRSQLIYGGLVKVSLKRIKSDYVLLIYSACFSSNDAKLIYRERWSIECMFKAMKSQGFNMEDTHLNKIDRLASLLKTMTVAFIFAVVYGDLRNMIKPIKTKNHQRKVFSLFSYGLSGIRQILLKNKIFRLFARILFHIIAAIPCSKRLCAFTVRY